MSKNKKSKKVAWGGDRPQLVVYSKVIGVDDGGHRQGSVSEVAGVLVGRRTPAFGLFALLW